MSHFYARALKEAFQNYGDLFSDVMNEISDNLDLPFEKTSEESIEQALRDYLSARNYDIAPSKSKERTYPLNKHMLHIKKSASNEIKGESEENKRKRQTNIEELLAREYFQAVMVLKILAMAPREESPSTLSQKDFAADSLAVLQAFLENSPPQWKYIAFFASGEYFSQSGDYHKAIAQYEKSFELNYKFAPAFASYGALLSLSDNLEQSSKALKPIEYALKLDPNNIKALNQQGIIFMEEERLDEALRNFDKVLEIDTENIDALSNQGELFERISDYREALVCYKTITKIDPKNAQAWNKGAQMLQRLEEHTEALSYYCVVILLCKETKPEENLYRRALDKVIILGDNPKVIEHAMDQAIAITGGDRAYLEAAISQRQAEKRQETQEILSHKGKGQK